MAFSSYGSGMSYVAKGMATTPDWAAESNRMIALSSTMKDYFKEKAAMSEQEAEFSKQFIANNEADNVELIKFYKENADAIAREKARDPMRWRYNPEILGRVRSLQARFMDNPIVARAKQFETQRTETLKYANTHPYWAQSERGKAVMQEMNDRSKMDPATFKATHSKDDFIFSPPPERNVVKDIADGWNARWPQNKPIVEKAADGLVVVGFDRDENGKIMKDGVATQMFRKYISDMIGPNQDDINDWFGKVSQGKPDANLLNMLQDAVASVAGTGIKDAGWQKVPTRGEIAFQSAQTRGIESDIKNESSQAKYRDMMTEQARIQNAINSGNYDAFEEDLNAGYTSGPGFSAMISGIDKKTGASVYDWNIPISGLNYIDPITGKQVKVPAVQFTPEFREVFTAAKGSGLIVSPSADYSTDGKVAVIKWAAGGRIPITKDLPKEKIMKVLNSVGAEGLKVDKDNKQQWCVYYQGLGLESMFDSPKKNKIKYNSWWRTNNPKSMTPGTAGTSAPTATTRAVTLTWEDTDATKQGSIAIRLAKNFPGLTPDKMKIGEVKEAEVESNGVRYIQRYTKTANGIKYEELD